MINKFKFLNSRILSIYLFVGFGFFNLYFFVYNFLNTFLNPSGNGDEYYQFTLYSFSNIFSKKFFYTPSQPYIFLSSIMDIFVNNPKYSTRIISLIACVILINYFLKRIISYENNFLENLYKSTLFICAIFITNQIFMGTPDFLSVALVIIPFLLILENIKDKKINLTIHQSIFVGIFFGLSIATRPTTLVLIFAFYITLFFLTGIKTLFAKQNLIACLSILVFLFMINLLPIIEQHKIILDVKEIPESTGVNWFQRNYLMAKYWDSNKIPNTQWISTQEVIDFKQENPEFEYPKNQIDLFLKEPGLYFRQIIRMFIKAMYSNYRYMYLLFPLLFLSFLPPKKMKKYYGINNTEGFLIQNKFIIIHHLISIILFSFLAVKLFEFRWVIANLILYCFFALRYLSLFPLKIRYVVYNISFLSGIGMYILFYVRYY